jgi:hypothetical protein
MDNVSANTFDKGIVFLPTKKEFNKLRADVNTFLAIIILI